MPCTYNLFTLLGAGASTGGTWSGAGTATSGYTPGANATLATFNSTGVPNGTYTFIYTVVSTTCTDTATITINVGSADLTVIWDSYTYVIANNATMLTTASILHTPYCTLNPAATALGTTDWTYATSISFQLATTLSVTSIVLYNQALAPTTVILTGYLSGVAGTTTAPALVFDGTNGNSVSTAIAICLNNFLGANGLASVSYASVENQFTIMTLAKKVTSGNWFGINKSVSVLTKSDASTVTAGAGFGIMNPGTRTATGNYTATICTANVNSSWTKVHASNGPMQALVDSATSNFNNIVPLGTSYTSYTTTTGTGPYATSCCF